MARILVVEDSPDNMKLFRAVLTLQGHTVTGLIDGEGLEEALRAEPPQVVLMDIQLPGSDGFALLRIIRSHPSGQIPVIALTAHAMPGDRERALEAGFDDYITKPIDIREFPGQIARAAAQASQPET